MVEEKQIGILGRGYPGIGVLLAYMAARDSKLTKEQKERRREEIRLSAIQDMRKAKVLKGMCPDCEDKLIRGKKNKRNEYKRLWACNNCNNEYSDDGTVQDHV